MNWVVPKNLIVITCEAQINVNSSNNYRFGYKLAINHAQLILIQPLTRTVNCFCETHSLDLCMRLSNAGILAIEFSFPPIHYNCPLRLSVNIFGKSFLQFYMCYPAYIHHVSNYFSVYIIICRFSTRRPVFDINNMFGEKDFIGISGRKSVV